MVDPMDAPLKLQEAIDRDVVRLRPGDVYPDLGVWMDKPAGRPRLTYAKTTGRTVEGIALFVHTDPIDGIPCFQTGYAVIETIRRKGVGSDIVTKGIEEMKNGLRRNGVKEFYVEAVVGVGNVASNKLAKRLLSDTPEEITDELSGEQAFQYLKLIKCSS